MQMLLQFYTILFETSVCAYVMAWRYGYALDKILKFCFCFLFCELKLFHDSSYIQTSKTNIKWLGDINSLNLLVIPWPHDISKLLSWASRFWISKQIMQLQNMLAQDRCLPIAIFAAEYSGNFAYALNFRSFSNFKNNESWAAVIIL